MATPSHIITRCPQCATAFRVTQEVLKVANGTVRCGSCLKVFNAHDRVVGQTAKSADKPTAKPKPTPAKPKNKEANDESWALALLEEEEKNANTSSSPKNTQPKTDNTPPKQDISPKQTKPPIEEATSKQVTTNIKKEREIVQADQVDEKNTLLDTIELDPLEFHEEASPSSWPWIIGATLMSMVLIAQIAWLRFDELSLRQPYRNHYANACHVLGCQLPPLIDIESIETTHLIVRGHPEVSNSLIADAIIINNAIFEQPYPGLRLEFLNIHGETVASRNFQPSDYLRGDLIEATIMPISQPIQLALEIVDPGESAVNYHIKMAPTSEQANKK